MFTFLKFVQNSSKKYFSFFNLKKEKNQNCKKECGLNKVYNLILLGENLLQYNSNMFEVGNRCGIHHLSKLLVKNELLFPLIVIGLRLQSRRIRFTVGTI